jgi:hypothetical protein
MNRKRHISILVSLFALLVATFACGPTCAGKPTIQILAPPNGSQVAVGQQVEVKFRAEDAKAVAWVKMEVDGAAVATMQSPVAEGQTPLEGILRWTPSKEGTFNLILTAQSASGQASDPAAVTIEVVAESAGLPDPTSAPTAPSQPTKPAPTTKPGQPTATTKPTDAATKPAAPTKKATAAPTQKPTAVPTKQPTAEPTKQPTAVPPTTVPQPEIVAFLSDKDEVYPGECVTLQWTTRNADEIYLDQWAVAVPAGEKIICYDEMGLGDNWFRLTAVNSAGSVFEDKLIRAEPPPETIIPAPFVPGMSGSVSSDGRDLPFVSPGDDGSDNVYEGFMTFDIRGLPGNATIVSAYLNLGTCDTNGDPVGLSQLHVLNLQYGDLDTGDYGAGGAYIASVDPCTIFSIDVTDQVEAMKAEVYFQVRLHFDGSDFDGSVDDVTYSDPTLDITYIIQ